MNRPDHLRRLEAVLDIARTSLPLLVTPAPEAGAEQQAFRREKFLCETALLAYAAGTVPEVRASVLRLAELLAPHARSPEILTLMRIRPVMAPELSFAHACLTTLGLVDPSFEQALQRIGAEGHPPPERAPWKDIEGDWLSCRCPVFQRLPGLDKSILRTTLVTGLDALSSRREDLYAFTHALIYLSDFGRKPPQFPRHAGLVLQDAGAALARSLDEDDFDLCAELLMSWPYLRQPLSPTARFGLQVLCAVEDEVGYLPSLGLAASELAGLSTESRRRTVLDEAYHTIYVMGLLMAALLQAGMPGSAPSPPPPQTPGASEALLRLMPERSPRPQWERKFDRLAAAEREALADMLAAIALRRALMRHDLRRLRDILACCVSYRLTDQVTVQQAGQLLGRFTEERSVA